MLSQKEFYALAGAAGLTFIYDRKDTYNLSYSEKDLLKYSSLDYEHAKKDQKLLPILEKIKSDSAGFGFSIKWLTGGVDGGNCWNTGGHYNLTPETKPEFVVLEDFIQNVLPQISFFDYKKKVLPLIKKTEEHDSGYYGNNKTFGVDYILVDALYKMYKEIAPKYNKVATQKEEPVDIQLKKPKI